VAAATSVGKRRKVAAKGKLKESVLFCGTAGEKKALQPLREKGVGGGTVQARPRLVLHFDVNETILVSGSVFQVSVW
jgi:hypothetical protein